MSDNKHIMPKPTIVVDLAKNRIRIHKKTIHNLGNPASILLLVNPADHTFGVIGCSDNEYGSHRIKFNIIKYNCYELYSRSLIHSLQSVCPQWKNGEKYRIVGELFPAQKAACFNMKTAQPISNAES